MPQAHRTSSKCPQDDTDLQSEGALSNITEDVFFGARETKDKDGPPSQPLACQTQPPGRSQNTEASSDLSPAPISPNLVWGDLSSPQLWSGSHKPLVPDSERSEVGALLTHSRTSQLGSQDFLPIYYNNKKK